ncbi:hypothetical protein MMC14_005318 [Varicellaria rhodocarpa]|nr:hypothetical protein [Varicellaria rhodocarpa]
MPRPKRTKLALSAPAPTTRVQTLNTTIIANTPSSPQSSARDATNSDDSEGLVKVNKSGVNRRGIAKKNARMSGALAVEDGGGTRLKPLTGRQRAAVSKIARDADHAKAIEGLKKRKEEAEAKLKNQQAIIPARMPEADARQNEQQPIVPSSMPEIDAAGSKSDMESKQIAHVGTVERAWPVPILKAPATPIADTSILALANFKRRPRQPSILQIGRDEPAEETDIDDLDDFQPNDESTPFHLSRSRYDVQHTPASHISSSQKMLSSGSRKRKLTSPEVQISPITQVPSSPAQHVEQMSVLDSNPYQLPHYDRDILKPGLPITKSRRPVTPEIWSDTMAPPQSSSPIQETPPPTRPTHVTNAKKPNRQQPTRKPISNSPAPPRSISKLKDGRPLQALKPMTTASLQNLLPRRKRHVQTSTDDGFDLPNSSDVELDTTGLGEYEDELSFAKPTLKKGGKKTNRIPSQPKSKGKTAKRTAAPITKPSKLSPRKVTPGKTYTRRLSDKENPPKDRQEKQSTSVSKSKSTSSLLHNHDLTLDSLENSSILDPNNEEEEEHPSSPSAQRSPAKKGTKDKDKDEGSKELKEMARKFREVDRWEMEFEEVTASSSSPRDAR